MKNIDTNNTQLTSCIQICRDRHSADFQTATTYLATQVAQIFPQSQPGSNTRPRGRIANPCRRQVSKVVKKNGKVTCNGVDITDTERYYSPSEWAKLTPEGKKLFNNCPKRKAKKEALAVKKKRKTSAVTTSNNASEQMDEKTRTIATAVINGVMNASQANADTNSVNSRSILSGSAQMPQHGTHVSVSAASNRSRHTYDQFGNIVHE